MTELSEISDRDLHREQRRRNKLRKKRSRTAHGLPKRKKGMGCRIGDRDFAAMEARKFQDPSSYIRRDGSEVLKGDDWRRRKMELHARADGRCEYHFPDGTRCSCDGFIPAHVIPRHPRRDDRMSNLKDYCVEHDRLMEKQSWRRVRSGKVGA